MAVRILHLFGWDRKFFSAFHRLVQEHFENHRHRFIIYGNISRDEIEAWDNTVVLPSIRSNAGTISAAMARADKIVLHGLFSFHLVYLLSLQPWVLDKCYWVIWGGDLYVRSSARSDLIRWVEERLRRFVVSRIGCLVSFFPGDVDLAQRLYRAQGQYIESFVYPSNIFEDIQGAGDPAGFKKILVGNSAAVTNRHIEVFDQLALLDDGRFEVVCPLSYGDSQNAAKVAKAGEALFGDRFEPLTEFLEYEEYVKVLRAVDVAVFAAQRQQALGNIVSLLGLGKKVVLDKSTSQAHALQAKGFKVFELAEALNDGHIFAADLKRNEDLARQVFAKQALVESLRRIWDG